MASMPYVLMLEYKNALDLIDRMERVDIYREDVLEPTVRRARVAEANRSPDTMELLRIALDARRGHIRAASRLITTMAGDL